jgi:ABC-type phosphate transport system auxiliary subunit
MDKTTKAYEEKISAQLQQAKAQLEGLEARAKSKMAQAEIETIGHLKATQRELEKKRQDLKTSVDAKVQQIKSEIDKEMATFKTSLEQLAAKLKGEHAKAGG